MKTLELTDEEIRLLKFSIACYDNFLEDIEKSCFEDKRKKLDDLFMKVCKV